MTINIDNLTEEELSDLNRRIVQRLKFLESQHTHREMMQFSIGENVSFAPPGKARQAGVLVRHNKKTVTIITEGGRRWNVSPHLLSREPLTLGQPEARSWPEAITEASTRGNVVSLQAHSGFKARLS